MPNTARNAAAGAKRALLVAREPYRFEA